MYTSFNIQVLLLLLPSAAAATCATMSSNSAIDILCTWSGVQG